jgi:hypothetical protein
MFNVQHAADYEYQLIPNRSKHPDEATVKQALMELQENNTHVSQLKEVRFDHCQ